MSDYLFRVEDSRDALNGGRGGVVGRRNNKLIFSGTLAPDGVIDNQTSGTISSASRSWHHFSNKPLDCCTDDCECA